MPFDRPRLDKLLLALLGSEELVDKWWISPNEAFRGVTPEEVFKESEGVVINYILDQFHH